MLAPRPSTDETITLITPPWHTSTTRCAGWAAHRRSTPSTTRAANVSMSGGISRQRGSPAACSSSMGMYASASASYSARAGSRRAVPRPSAAASGSAVSVARRRGLVYTASMGASASAASQSASAAVCRRPSGAKGGSAGPTSLSTRRGRAWRTSSSSMGPGRVGDTYSVTPRGSALEPHPAAPLGLRGGHGLVPGRSGPADLPRVRLRRAGHRGGVLPGGRLPGAGQRGQPGHRRGRRPVAAGPAGGRRARPAGRCRGGGAVTPHRRAVGLARMLGGRPRWRADRAHRGPRRPPPAPTSGLMRRTKIIATLGPASDDPEVLADLLDAGVDVVRLGLAHGPPAEHRDRIRRVREQAERRGRTVGVLADLPGPKVRTGPFGEGGAFLAEGDEVALVVGIGPSDASRITVDEAHLAECVTPGDQVVLGDGIVTLEV